jgi:hypothetical protein
MRSVVTLLFITWFGHSTSAQGRFFLPADTVSKSRLIPVSIGIGATWSGSMIGLSQVWYKDITKSKWHTFDDSKNWLQMDKLGHFYTSYQINKLTSSLFRWSGVNHKTSVIIGSGVSLGYQTTLEMLDGYTHEWGFSWSDMAGNALGTGIYVLQELTFKEQRILPKFSYHPTQFAALRPEVLGSNFAESLLKDYNGQTYWLSTSIGSFFPKSGIPEWVCISLGYSAHEKIVGDQPTYYSASKNYTYHEQREWILSLDVDFSKLTIKKPWLKAIINQFNYLKIPFPALVLRDNVLHGAGIYF